MEQSQTALLKELVKWTRVGFYSSVRDMLAEVLKDEKEKLIYSLADGKRTNDVIRKEAETSPNRITALQKKCESLGLMETNDAGRRVALFDLEDFGLSPSTEKKA